MDPERVFLKMARDNIGRLLAIAFTLEGENIVVLDAEEVEDKKQGLMWYKRVRIEQPWVHRH